MGRHLLILEINLSWIRTKTSIFLCLKKSLTHLTVIDHCLWKIKSILYSINIVANIWKDQLLVFGNKLNFMKTGRIFLFLIETHLLALLIHIQGTNQPFQQNEHQINWTPMVMTTALYHSTMVIFYSRIKRQDGNIPEFRVFYIEKNLASRKKGRIENVAKRQDLEQSYIHPTNKKIMVES